MGEKIDMEKEQVQKQVPILIGSSGWYGEQNITEELRK